MSRSTDNAELLRRAACGDEGARQELLFQHQTRLKAMIRLRLHDRLRGRLDPSDVLQDAYVEAVKRLNECVQHPPHSFFLWLRQITLNKLAEVHRHHLDIQARDVRREVAMVSDGGLVANSGSLAIQLLDDLSSPSQRAMQAELRIQLQQALDAMDSIDREVIALRHFEQLNSEETAIVLGMSKSGASSRYVRAMRRLHAAVLHIPGLEEPPT